MSFSEWDVRFAFLQKIPNKNMETDVQSADVGFKGFGVCAVIIVTG